MGVGRPVDIIRSVEQGIDMFDAWQDLEGTVEHLQCRELNLRNSKYSDDESPDKNIDCFASNEFSNLTYII